MSLLEDLGAAAKACITANRLLADLRRSLHHPEMSRPVSPFSTVLRFSDVKLGRSKLEEALGMPLDRFEAARKGVFNSAQINIPEDGDDWLNLTTLVDRIGPAVARLVLCNDIGEPCVDFAMHFYDDKFSTSLRLPSIVAERFGHWGFAIEVSVYRTSVD